MSSSSTSALFRGNCCPLLLCSPASCTSCSYDLRSLPFPEASRTSCRLRRYQSKDSKFCVVSKFYEKKRRIVCRATDTEPDNNDNKETDAREGSEGEAEPRVDSLGQQDPQPDSPPSTVLNEVTSVNGETIAEGGTGEAEDVEVASGSPLPGMKLDESFRIPKETIDILKDQVFGFDTFFVTSQEPYQASLIYFTQGGVLFKGNLRGQAAKSYDKIVNRLNNKFGKEYKVFLLTNPEDNKPIAVVVPSKTMQPETTAVPEWFAAGAFGLVAVFTLLLRNVPQLQSNLLSTFENPELLYNGLPGALVTALILGVHEFSHILVAKDTGIELGVPYFVPSWQIGSFGAITRIRNIVGKREDLLKVAAAGPLAGFSVGLVLLLLGFFLPPSDGIGIIVDPTVFHESFLTGGIAKLLLGDALKEGTPISINPLVIWAWSGLLINAINSIPAGELDGGRISFAIWGRKVKTTTTPSISSRLTGASIVLLGLSSLFNDIAFYWVVLIFFLQRGPIAPISEEISEPENKYIYLGVLVLMLGLLVCLPYPFPFKDEAMTSFL
ncbi:Probable zinc metalloprotease EGY2, chloroplastic [Linum perenne]